VITARQLAAAVGEQSGVPWEDVDALSIDRQVIEQLPADLAARYAVLPLREEGRTLVLASEGEVDPVSAAALARKLKRPVCSVIVPKGQVTVGLRHWYPQRPVEDPRRALEEAVTAGTLSKAKAEGIWQEYVSRQVLFAEILMSLGHLDRAALTAVLLRHDRASCSLGEYMVGLGMISAAAVEEALELQQMLQGSIDSLLKREGVTTLDAAELQACIA
jgi:adsorption protein B